MPEEYAKWERLGQVGISPDGKWTFAIVAQVEGDNRMEVKSSDGPQTWVVENVSRAEFTSDSKHLVYTLVPPREEAEKLRKAKKRVENKMGVHTLASGESIAIDGVASWRVFKDTDIVGVQRYGAETPSRAGSDFEFFKLGDRSSTPVGNVRTFTEHDKGGLVALHTVSATGQEAILVYSLPALTVETVAWSKGKYGAITWAEDAKTLAFSAGTEDPKKEGDWNTLFVASGFGTGKIERTAFDPKSIDAFPAGMRVSEAGGLSLSKDGTSLLFGIAPWRDKTAPTAPGDVAGVQIWNTKDVIVMPLQERTAGQERNRTTTCVWTVGAKTFSPFAAPELDSVRVSPDHKWAIAFDAKPYESPIKVNGLEYVDVLVIDIEKGTTRKMLEKAVSNAGGVDASSIVLSPQGTYALYFDGKDWISDRLADGKKQNLTAKFKLKFFDRDDDHTVPKPPAAGFPVWQNDDARVFLHNDFDVFLINPETGDGMPITDGEKGEVRYRFMDVGLHDDGLRPHDPIYLSVFESRTKRSGFALWTHDEGFKTLALDDARLSWAAKSKDTDRVLFVYQTYDKSPAAFLTNTAFTAAKPMFHTNWRQHEYTWGRSELVRYKALGQNLEGTLIYPANWEPGKKYPMITYVYERLSDGLHQYQLPSNTSPYNQQHFSQAGYFVFMPDIVYEDRQPGHSAVTCIEAGLKAVFARNVGVDATKVGLTGHSWGGYETVFTATHSKMFAAYVAGAPLTELISMYSSFYWNWGQTNQVIFEVSQGRMAVPFWEDTRAYIDNSPLFHAGDITAPMLVEVGTADGAVDWHQGQYLYNTLRRMGKNMVMLVYEGENHGLAQPANMKDYAMRARHFFDVYLKGEKPEKWVNEGVPFIRLGEELRPKKDGEGG